MRFEDLSPEQLKKASACDTPEDVLALAKEEGYELSDEELQSVSGGSWSPKDALPQCPACGSYAILINPLPATGCTICTCHDCGHRWTKTLLDPILPI